MIALKCAMPYIPRFEMVKEPPMNSSGFNLFSRALVASDRTCGTGLRTRDDHDQLSSNLLRNGLRRQGTGFAKRSIKNTPSRVKHYADRLQSKSSGQQQPPQRLKPHQRG